MPCWVRTAPGKSDACEVLAGMHQPDEGRIYNRRAGRSPMKTPLEAKAEGVVLIHQELSLAEEMSGLANTSIWGGCRARGSDRRRKKLRGQGRRILERLKCGFGPEVNCGRPVDRPTSRWRNARAF